MRLTTGLTCTTFLSRGCGWVRGLVARILYCHIADRLSSKTFMDFLWPLVFVTHQEFEDERQRERTADRRGVRWERTADRHLQRGMMVVGAQVVPHLLRQGCRVCPAHLSGSLC